MKNINVTAFSSNAVGKKRSKLLMLKFMMSLRNRKETSNEKIEEAETRAQFEPVYERPRISSERFVRLPGCNNRFKKDKEQRGGNRRGYSDRPQHSDHLYDGERGRTRLQRDGSRKVKSYKRQHDDESSPGRRERSIAWAVRHDIAEDLYWMFDIDLEQDYDADYDADWDDYQNELRDDVCERREREQDEQYDRHYYDGGSCYFDDEPYESGCYDDVPCDTCGDDGYGDRDRSGDGYYDGGYSLYDILSRYIGSKVDSSSATTEHQVYDYEAERMFSLASEPGDDHCAIDFEDGYFDDEDALFMREVMLWAGYHPEPKPVFERPRFSTEQFVRLPGRKVRFKKDKEQRGGNRRGFDDCPRKCEWEVNGEWFRSRLQGDGSRKIKKVKNHFKKNGPNRRERLLARTGQNDIAEAFVDHEVRAQARALAKARRRMRRLNAEANAHQLATRMDKVGRSAKVTAESGRKRLECPCNAADVAALNAHIRSILFAAKSE